MFGAHYDLDEAEPLLRGSVFSDRGVYKLGEEVHVKAILRSRLAGRDRAHQAAAHRCTWRCATAATS